MITIMMAAILAASPAQTPTANLLVIGDSLTASGEIVDRVARRLPWITWVGGIDSPWRAANHCGYSGYSAGMFVDTEAVPFRPAGSLDMGPYFAANGTPTIVVIGLGINNVFNATDATDLNSRISAEIADIDAMITEVRAEAGAGTKIIVTAPGESSTSSTLWEADYDPPKDSRARWEGYRAEIVTQWASHYDGRTGEGIYYYGYALQGADGDYSTSALHPNALGKERMAHELAAVICAAVGGCT